MIDPADRIKKLANWSMVLAIIALLLVVLSVLVRQAEGANIPKKQSMGEITNVDTTVGSLITGSVLLWHEGLAMWVPGPYDTSFAFSFLTFTDNQTSPQLIGSGEWQAIAAIIFTCTYENGPPDSMLVWVNGDFDGGSGSGWTGDYFAFDNAAKLTDTTSEANNYPDDANDVITFYGTAHGDDDSTTKTVTVSFPNDTRWGTSTESGTLDDADVNGLASSDLDEDKTQNWGSVNAGASDYIVLAFPDRLGTLNTSGSSIQFRFRGMNAGFTLQDLDPHVNSAGYSENYNVYRSNIVDLGDSVFRTDQTGYLNMVKYEGTATGTYNSTFIDNLTDYDVDNDQTQTATSSGWAVSMGASDYSFIAVPSRWSLSTSQFRYVTGGVELQAGFTEEGSNISWQNLAGFTENYDIFKSVVQDLDDGDIGVGQSAIRQRFYYGTSTKNSGFSESDVEGLAYNEIWQDTDNTRTWSNQITPGASDYIVFACPSRCGDLQHGTDYETDGDQGTEWTFDGLTAAWQNEEVVSITNEYGFTENYDVYANTTLDIGDGAGTLITYTSPQELNYQYWGVHTDASAAAWALADFNTMSSQGGGSKSTSTDVFNDPHFTVTAGAGEYIWFCHPTRLADSVIFYVGGFEGGFEPHEEPSLTNINGWSEDMSCWRSTNANLGETSVTTVEP